MRRETRTDDPNDARNWSLDCAFPGCGERFAATMLVGQVAEHWNRHAGGKLENGKRAEHDTPNLRLTWLGVGQPPKGRPSFLQ